MQIKRSRIGISNGSDPEKVRGPSPTPPHRTDGTYLDFKNKLLLVGREEVEWVFQGKLIINDKSCI